MPASSGPSRPFRWRRTSGIVARRPGKTYPARNRVRPNGLGQPFCKMKKAGGK
ncbi:hypothetical protein MCA2499 [Methylococcus capsulatus str. Bath]|uniref:Uncharacterized protein n=1 Tax=Methylococcus capsulatus (strain ATCC 33009 / NCIMB 11132 / Bath) TaxID=243233 RepID=Q604N9_METCA|nr:hypothetical protein MCA2499 [Methylococcus capsulatus str. Bath]